MHLSYVLNKSCVTSTAVGSKTSLKCLQLYDACNQNQSSTFTLRILISRKDLLRSLKLSHDRLPPLLAADSNPALEIMDAAQESFGIAPPRIHIHRRILALHKLKRPEQLRHCQEEIPLRQMDARADATARAVAVMVTYAVVR
jgi:hypothetical protein